MLMTDTYTDEEVEAFLEALFDAIAPGDRFVLGFGDNVPTDAVFSRILQVVGFYHRHSTYPALGRPDRGDTGSLGGEQVRGAGERWGKG